MAGWYWQDNRITPLELTGIVISLIFATGAVTLPMFTGLVAQHDGWLASLTGAVVGALTLAVILYLDRRFPGAAFPDYSQRLLGTALSKVVLFLYAAYFLHVASLVVRESTDFLRTGFYPAASPLVLGTPLLILTTYMVWHGLEVIGRTTLIVVPIQIVFTIIVTAATAAQVEPELILPLFERGALPVLRASLIPAAWFGEVNAIAFFLSSVRGRRGRAAAAGAGMAVVMILIVVGGLSAAMLFGDQTGRLAYPLSSVARFVTIGGFLRIDPLAMAVWLFLTVIKVATVQHVTTITLARLLGLRDDRPLAVPLAGLILVLSDGLFSNKQEVDAWLLAGWPVYAFCLQLLLPAGLALLAAVRGAGNRRAGERP
ncbi:MAG TPA: endospore germination permease [Limnochordales bacterium]